MVHLDRIDVHDDTANNGNGNMSVNMPPEELLLQHFCQQFDRCQIPPNFVSITANSSDDIAHVDTEGIPLVTQPRFMKS